MTPAQPISKAGATPQKDHQPDGKALPDVELPHRLAKPDTGLAPEAALAPAEMEAAPQLVHESNLLQPPTDAVSLPSSPRRESAAFDEQHPAMVARSTTQLGQPSASRTSAASAELQNEVLDKGLPTAGLRGTPAASRERSIVSSFGSVLSRLQWQLSPRNSTAAAPALRPRSKSMSRNSMSVGPIRDRPLADGSRLAPPLRRAVTDAPEKWAERLSAVIASDGQTTAQPRRQSAEAERAQITAVLAPPLPATSWRVQRPRTSMLPPASPFLSMKLDNGELFHHDGAPAIAGSWPSQTSKPLAASPPRPPLSSPSSTAPSSITSQQLPGAA